MSMTEEKDMVAGIEVAVIGMSARFPGANSIDEFWENLKNGVGSISFFSEEELKQLKPDLVNHPNYVNSKGGVLENKDRFDALFFGYTPLEAELMDPQIRLFHECCWEALEKAGYNPDSYNGLIGLYAGASNNFHWEALSFLSGTREDVGEFTASQLTDKDFLCTRISYKLNLSGPAVAVQSACSTSLVAIHLACQAILGGECDMALAGGVSVFCNQETGYIYREGMIYSPDGKCRAFDAKAKGIVGGSGAGVVLLKLLADALKDGDTIDAVVKGSAINNDGSRRSGFTTPSQEGQSQVIVVAQQAAEVEPGSITYIEAHGTGTPLGDPIEIEALKRAFGIDKKGYCAIGSVKTNLGHLNAAAGAAGFIKTVLALKHRLIPPSLCYESPNPNIDFFHSPFYVNTELREWKNDDYPLRAGVSSFGIGGTNAHVILEEAPAFRGQKTEDRGQSQGRGGVTPPDQSRQYQLILLSAKTGTALDKIAENLVNHLKENPGINIADVAYTLQVGRKPLEHKQILVCSQVKQAVEALCTGDSSRVHSFFSKDEDRSVVFMFPGIGAQYVNMGLELYQKEPVFRQEMDRCFGILNGLVDYDIKEILYPRSKHYSFNRSNRSDTSYKSYKSYIHQTEIAQPLIFIFEYALAKLLMQWGIKPDAMIGYSFGEYATACLSGVFSLKDALKVVVLRGQLMQKVPRGLMLSVPLTKEDLEPFLAKNNELGLSIDNGDSCVVSGPVAAVEAFEKEMKTHRYLCMRLGADRAVHSKMMASISTEFENHLGRFSLNQPQIPYISNLTGQWISPEQAADPRYWANHLQKTVRFTDGIKELLKSPETLLVEIGPGRDLSAIMMRYIENSPDQHVINLVRPQEKEISDVYYLLNKIGQLWLYGVPVDWCEFYAGEQRQRIPLPTYPFAREHYWLEADPDKAALEKPVRDKHPDLSDWFGIPSWGQQLLLPTDKLETMKKSTWLVFLDECGIGAMLVERLKNEGHDVITIIPGKEYKKQGVDTYTINPSRGNDYYLFFNDLNGLKSQSLPDKILHFWGVSEEGPRELSAMYSDRSFAWFHRAQDLGFYSLLYLAKAVAKQGYPGTVEITVVTNYMQQVTEEEAACPEKAAVLGPLTVIPQEQPNIICRSIDLVLPRQMFKKRKLSHQLWDELNSKSMEPVVAFRGNSRWVQTFVPVHLDEVEEKYLPLKEKGVYLITGGMGKIGFILARYLAGHFNARLILTGRSANPGSDESSPKAKKIKELEEMGAEVMVFQADAANRAQMLQVIQQTEARFGKINGVIHSVGINTSESIDLVRGLEKTGCEEQFRTKAHSLLILGDLLNDHKLDFCWVISSIAAILGGLKFAAYAAVNRFMDAYIKVRNQFSTSSWMSVDWEGIDPEKIITGFLRTLALGDINQIVVSRRGNLLHRIDQWVKLKPLRELSPLKLRPRPPLMNPYLEPGNSIEQTIAHIWQRLFGIDPIGVQDDFFELGGDSLKAITVIAKIHKELQVEIPLPEFFKRLTVENLAKYINRAKKTAFSGINPVEEKDYFVLSSAQKRLYILQQMEKESIGYNETLVVLLEGKVDKDKFEKSFRQLIRRHESLRTSVILVKEEPVQRIHNQVPFEIKYYDMKQVEVKVEEELSPLLEGTGGLAPLPIELAAPLHSSQPITTLISSFIRPFDLSQPPFLRVAFIKIAEDQQVLMVDRHHIITDGVSHQVFVKELITLYEGQPLPSLKIQYKDYAHWQNSQKRQKALKKQKQYWIQEFVDEIPVLDLPFDYPRPQVQSFAGNALRFSLENEQHQALKRLALKEGVTLFMELLSIYYIFLSKISGQEDIIIGTPITGRAHDDLQHVMGILVNTLALRNFPLQNKTFKEFLKEVKESALKAFENQDYQFEELIEQVVANIKRDMSRNPLFDAVFVLQNIDMDKQQPFNREPQQETTDFTLKPYGYEHQTAKFDLNLQAVDGGDQVMFLLEYCTRLFKEDTIKRFIKYFKKIGSQVLTNPDMHLFEIEIISREERQQLLYDFNGKEAGYPVDKTLHELFANQVEQTPDQIAVGGTRVLDPLSVPVSLTYRELNKQSHQLAHLLIEKGVQTDTIVGIMLERSVEMIVGILGILKAGGAYLPIDPDYPEERINYMLTDSGTRVLLTAKNKERPFINEINMFDMSYSTCFHPPPSRRGNPAASLAYVIYTSGTTGQPKGVMIEHKNVVRLFFNDQFQFDFHTNDVWTLFHSFCFDFSVWEMYGALLYGGKLVVIPKRVSQDIVMFLEILKTQQVTILNQTPTVFYHLVDEELNQPDRRLNLKYVIFGGEALKPAKLKEWKLKYPAAKLVNMFGITETTVHVTYKEIRDEEIRLNTSNIGKPIPTLNTYVMDSHLKLLPIGVTRECCVGGLGVGRGYLNRPGLTREKFVENPYKPGEQLYRSGDLVRRLANGELEYLGRIDQQVKIRGFRIELGEIENQLMGHEQVKEAVVTAGEDKNGDRYLCAYFVPVKWDPTAHTAIHQELRRHLSRSLPGYMVPAYFMPLEAIPLTANGKLDGKALPIPGITPITTYTAPQNEIQKKLLNIWAEVLSRKHREIGIDDNFFELGGHSLKAMTLAANIHKKLNIRLQVPVIFTNPTIRTLAAFISQTTEEKYSPIKSTEKQEYYDASYAQKRVWILSQLEASSLSFNIPAAYFFEQEVEAGVLAKVFHCLIQRHESLRTVFFMSYQEIKQKILPPEESGFNLEYVDLSTIEDAREKHEKIKQRTQMEQSTLFDLQDGPLLRVQLVRIERKKYMLLFTMHHIISDFISIDILYKEAFTLYESFSKNNSEKNSLELFSLEPLKIQYRDYTAWQNQRLTGQNPEQFQQYWQNRFKGKLPVLELPYDGARPKIPSYRGQVVEFTIRDRVTEQLRVVGEKHNTTLFMVLLSTFYVLLFHYSGQTDIIIGTPVSGREHADLENQIGFYLNTLPLRLKFNERQTFTELLSMTKRITLEAYQHQLYPFDRLVDDLGIRRDMSRHPLFDVVVDMMNLIRPADAREPGKENRNKPMKDQELTFHASRSKFDLTVYFIERTETITVVIEYSIDLFDTRTIARMVKRYRTLLDSILKNTHTPISKLQSQPDEEISLPAFKTFARQP